MLGTGKKTVVLENGGKGSHIIHNQEEKKLYTGLESQQRYFGEAVNGEAVLGGQLYCEMI